MKKQTQVEIRGEQFFINGRPTCEGRYWKGHRIEGLLLNSRMVQGIFDDSNLQTRQRWAYPDTGKWDPNRNTNEFVAAMPQWKKHGLLAFTLNLQGGSPEGYSNEQPWENSAIDAKGDLRPDYMERLSRILDKADELGMVVILGIFYFGQEKQLRDESAVVRAVENITDWLFDRDDRNVLIEINNECNIRYTYKILKPDYVHELILLVCQKTRNGRRFLAGTSYSGNKIPGANVVRCSDFILLHGNGAAHPGRIAEMVREVRQVEDYSPKPILFNEDDHFNFDDPANNFDAAISEYASWGLFDYRMKGEGFTEGYQCVPVDWGIRSKRKLAFFNHVAEISGACP